MMLISKLTVQADDMQICGTFVCLHFYPPYREKPLHLKVLKVSSYHCCDVVTWFAELWVEGVPSGQSVKAN